MADLVWGGLSGGSVPRFKAGLRLVAQDTAPSSGSAYVEVAAWFGTPNSIAYNNLTYNWAAFNGSTQIASGSGTFSATGSNMEKEIGRFSFRNPVDWRDQLTYSVRLRIPNPVGGGTAEVWFDGRTPFAVPATPSPAVATLLTGPERASLSWLNVQSQGARVQTVAIDRESGPYDGGPSSTYRIANIGESTGMVDNSLERGFGYRYRVQAQSSDGQSGWAYTGWIDTTPLDPSAVVATKAANNVDVAVTWTNPPGWCAGRQSGKTEIWDVGSGTPVLLVTLDNGPTSWTHVSPSASAPHRYNVRLATFGPPVLKSSDAVLSNTIVLITPPLAPTGIGPLVLDPTASPTIPVTWTHNPVDTTAQTYFSLQHRLAGSSTWTTLTKVASSVSSWTPNWTYTLGQSVEVQVQTWGAHANPGPWSPTAVIKMDGRPTATNQVPMSLTGASLTATHTFFDPEGTAQSTAVWRLLDASGNVLESIAINGAGTSVTFRTRLENGFTYSTDVQVRDGAGQWSLTSAVTSTVTYLPPVLPSVSSHWDEPTGACQITLGYIDPNPLTEVTMDTVEIWRGPVRIASILAPLPGAPVTVIDPIPPTDADAATYEVVAWASSGSQDTQTVEIEVPRGIRRAIWLNAGPGWSTIATAAHGLKIDEDSERAVQGEQFAGRTHQVLTFGEAITETIKISGRIPPGTDRNAFRAVQEAGTVVCLRWPEGRRWVMLTGPSLSTDGQGSGHTVSLSAEVVDHQEV